MRAMRTLRLVVMILLVAGWLHAADQPRSWDDLEHGRQEKIVARALALSQAWSKTGDAAQLQEYSALIGEIRAYPRAKPADRVLVERLVAEFLALPGGNEVRTPELIRAQAALVDQLLTEDAWSAAQAADERQRITVRLSTITMKMLRLVADNAKSGWKAPHVRDPRAGVVIGGPPRVIDPAAIASYEQAMIARSTQRAWNDAAALIRTSLPLAARRSNGDASQTGVSALLLACGVEAKYADSWSRVYTVADQQAVPAL